MHELSVVLGVIETVEKYAVEHELKQIETLVLQIGEFSPVIPGYVESCYPLAANGTILERTRLEIEVLPGVKDFYIKEIVVSGDE